MYSISANTMYSIDENGKHSLEISYQDSDGTNVGAYAEGDKFENVLLDAIDQLDEAIAESDDDQADVEESEQLQSQIEELQSQIASLQAQLNEHQTRNEELQKRHAEKLDRIKNKKNLKDMLNDSNITLSKKDDFSD